MKIPTRLVLASIFLSALFLPSLASAADSGISGFNAQTFRPSLDSSGVYNVYGSRVPAHLHFNTAFIANFASGTAHVSIPAIPVGAYVQDKSLAGDFQFAIGLYDRVAAGIDLPVYFYERGTSLPDLAAYRTAALGDLRLDVKFRLLRDRGHLPGIAFLSQASFPTGSRQKFTGDKGVGWEGRLVADKTFRSFSVSANVGYRLIGAVRVNTTGTGVATSALNDDRLTFGIGSNVTLPLGKRRWSILGEFWGESVVKDMTERTTPLEIRGGVQREFKNGMVLALGAGKGLTQGYGAPKYRAFAGLGFSQERRQRLGEKAASKAQPISHSIHFASDSAKIRPPEMEEIMKLAEDARARGARLIVAGHADSTGSRSYNMRLSLARARVVGAALTAAGLPEEHLKIEAHGEDIPAAENSTREGRAQNRRVEIEEVDLSPRP